MAAKIPPALKAYMKQALPGGADEPHVLALGEDHLQTDHLEFLTHHLPELKAEHRLGAIGVELAPFMDVFLWAYQDGRLPVEKGQESTYLRSMVLAHYDYAFKHNGRAKAVLAGAALDKGIQVTHFDTRYLLEDLAKRYSEDLASLDREIVAHPSLVAHYRMGNYGQGNGTLNEYEQFPFLLREVQILLKENPNYKRRLDNIEAVILAARQLAKEGKEIGSDALSAALFKASMPEDKNALTISGYQHIMGLEIQEHNHKGTFAQHLAQHLNTSTALAGNSGELVKSFIDDQYLHSVKIRQGHSFHFPTMLVVDLDEVMPENPTEAVPGSVAEAYIEKRQEYNQENPQLADAPFPTAANKAEVAQSAERLNDPRIQAALEKVREDAQASRAKDRARHKSPNDAGQEDLGALSPPPPPRAQPRGGADVGIDPA